MGALHEGHLDLVREARTLCDTVIVSIFVNPTQFGPGEDYNKYPRTLEKDAELVASVGADYVFAPTVDEMYSNSKTSVHISELTSLYEGAFRPTHFDGVATIVLKLLNCVQPQRAFFGRKDLQQCAVVEQMVTDLNVPVDLVFVETRRETTGLALSSRNAYLSPEERHTAPELYRVLNKTRLAILGLSEVKRATINPVLTNSIEELASVGFAVDYLDIVSFPAMQPLDTENGQAFLVVAAKLGKTRLIDNIQVFAR